MSRDSSIPALSTVNLAIGYNGKALLSLPDLKLYSGEVVALLGENGIGKSTLLRSLTREQKPISGEVLVEGIPLHKLSRRELARKISVVTTDRDMSPGLLAREIVGMGRHPHTDMFSRFSKEDYEAVEEAMKLTGIFHKAACFFGELSDGERQKVMIARALAQQTPVMVLDEPFSFLDTAARIDILSLLKKLSERKGTAILFSSHDVAQALRMADFIWLLTPDRQLYRGKPSQLIENNTVEKLFNTSNLRFDPAQNDFIAK